MKKVLLGALLACTAAATQAYDQQGMFIGGGAASVTFDDCSECDASGLMLEAGYDFNRTVGLDFKLAQTTADDYDVDLDLTYIGANLGSDFGTPWFKLYGKLGIAHLRESSPGFVDDTESNIALGFGLRFTPVEDQSGFYIKLEGLSTRFLGEDVGIGMFALGYKFH